MKSSYPMAIGCANSAYEADQKEGAETITRRARYNATTNEGIASTRSKQKMRSVAESSAAVSGDLPLGEGLTLRAPMAGQCENDQFPFSTDAYGKPWS